jgi:hypothetical protein
MNEHQKRRQEAPQSATPDDPGDDGLGAAQQKMSELLAAGDAAIQAALSGDSEASLDAMRQRGGQ